MPITLNDNLHILTARPADDRYSKLVAGVSTPFASVAEANTMINSAYRHKGLTVFIDIGGGSAEYWYKEGVTDTDLVPKNISKVVDAFSLSANGSRSVLAGQTLIRIEFNATVAMTIDIGTTTNGTEVMNGLDLVAGETKYQEYVKKADTTMSIYFTNVSGGTLNIKFIKEIY